MDVLPVDVAEEMKECALCAGNATANERFGGQGEADAYKVKFNNHADNFKEKSKDLLSDSVCEDIKNMFWYQAWRTANERKGYSSDASRDIKVVEEKVQSILSSKDVSMKLTVNIREMGWATAWWCANTKVGYKDDAKRDQANYESFFAKIQGDINMVAMIFNIDKAKILGEKPKVISEQKLQNKSDIEQSMEFSFSVTEGTTKSTSHQIAFQYGVKVGFEANFFGFGGPKYEVSFQFSHSHTFSESMSKGVTKSYRFPLKVPAHSTYTARGKVQEAEMEVPYVMEFDFGTVKKYFNGIWKGVAVSMATYEIDKN